MGGIYCSSKWGVRGFAECMKVEARDTNVDIYNIYPGSINTDFWKESGLSSNTFNMPSPDEVAKKIIRKIKSSKESDIIL
jgi:short-subunit dehydrogenase